MSHPLQHLYDQIPALECKGLCGNGKDTCCTSISCTTLEAKLLDEYDGITSPWMPLPNGTLRTDAARLAPRLRCPHLGLDGKCTAYEVRPMICRLWGSNKKMACPHGCKPKNWLPDARARELLALAIKIAGDKPL